MLNQMYVGLHRDGMIALAVGGVAGSTTVTARDLITICVRRERLRRASEVLADKSPGTQ